MDNVVNFQQLVARLERECKASPTAYRVKVIFLALLGYAYIAVLLGVALGGLLFGLATLLLGHLRMGVQLLIVAGIMSAIVIRAFWVQIPPPKGHRLKPREAPDLFKLLARLRKREKGPRIHEIVLTAEFNASIMQTPRFGLFGGYRNSLLIGLPLMQGLSPKEFASVLAHEYGHLSHAHGKLGAWVYRVRSIWLRMAGAFDNSGSWLNRSLLRFFHWYIPYFNAYSFVLARRQEYEADRASARLVGARVAADALVAADLKGRFMAEQFWPGLYAQADRSAQPGFLPHAAMRNVLRRGAGDKDNELWLQESLKRTTVHDDTHPSLRSRLKRLGQRARTPQPIEKSAAQRLFGSRLPKLEAYFDKAWLRKTGYAWTVRHLDVREAEEIVSRYPKGFTPGFDPKLYAELGLAYYTLGEYTEALPLLRDAALELENSAETAMAAAQIMLAQGNIDAVRFLELAMSRNRDYICEATWSAWQFYAKRGDKEQAMRWRNRFRLIATETKNRALRAEQRRLYPQGGSPYPALLSSSSQRSSNWSSSTSMASSLWLKRGTSWGRSR
ncbi:MAG: M48 family metalloprotease [Betaproteobacteria bacterium]|nr:M48 family metalloprotease [Betaproteobacteria bacterium]